MKGGTAVWTYLLFNTSGDNARKRKQEICNIFVCFACRIHKNIDPGSGKPQTCRFEALVSVPSNVLLKVDKDEILKRTRSHFTKWEGGGGGRRGT
jgi:hypothetical protein